MQRGGVGYHTIPYHTIPYHTIPYHTIPYHTIPYITRGAAKGIPLNVATDCSPSCLGLRIPWTGPYLVLTCMRVITWLTMIQEVAPGGGRSRDRGSTEVQQGREEGSTSCCVLHMAIVTLLSPPNGVLSPFPGSSYSSS